LEKAVRIAVLMAVHNRWEMTKNVLDRLHFPPVDIDLSIYIVDDGSTDSTSFDVLQYPLVAYQRSDGNLFWAKAMKLAQDSVVDKVDYYLWLNNDVRLSDDFFVRILESIKSHPKTILVGQTSDPTSQLISYGGYKRIGRHPHRFKNVQAEKDYKEADTFCGNIVLIPFSINFALGGIDGEFEHGYADHDFGYRAVKMGYPIRIIPGFLGSCSRNPNILKTQNRLHALQLILSKKYLPIRSQIRFCKRHGGPEWILYVITPYVRTILGINQYRSREIDSGF
jgi:GT2 family glycosyltransferase